MDSVKEAFQKVKQDIFFLGQEMDHIKSEIFDFRAEIKLISSFINDLKIKLETHSDQKSTIPTDNPTHPSIRPLINPAPTDIPTVPQEIGGLLRPNTGISTGNRGVPTDRQTDKQTNQHTPSLTNADEESNENNLDHASEILYNLDKLKKEVRLKFKRLTSQELAVFSTLYNLDNQGEIVDYSLLSSKLKLSESSIRDYIGKIQKKGIPLAKEKLNNKRVILHIPQDLRKIATLDTILKLREL